MARLRAALFTVVATLSLAATAQPQVARAARHDPLEALVRAVEAGTRTTPLVEPSATGGEYLVTFLARRDKGRAPRIVSDVTGWGEQLDGTFNVRAGTMTRVGGSEWYALRATVAAGARIEYLLAYSITDYRLDPHNPRQTAGPDLDVRAASELVTPGYTEPPEIAASSGSELAGALQEATIRSQVLGTEFPIAIYTPPGSVGGSRYPVAVLLAWRVRQMSRIVETLVVKGALQPLVVVFILPKGPNNDIPASEPLRTFLTEELPAWLATRATVTDHAEDRAILGVSFSAKDALDAALAPVAMDSGSPRPAAVTAYSRLGLLIPGRRIQGEELAWIADRRTNHLAVAVLAGQYDHANVPTARRLRTALERAGHRVDYREVPEGHSPVTWRNHLGTVLTSLFPPKAQ